MSGIEVVGLILGILPIAIAACESYANLFPSHSKRRLKLRKVGRDLETQHVTFRNTCEILLLGVVHPDKMESMISNPFGNDDWADPAVTQKLEIRLWRSYQTFKRRVADIQEATDDLKQKLSLQDAKVSGCCGPVIGRQGIGQNTDRVPPLQEGGSSLDKLNARATYAINQSGYSDAIDQIRQANHSLSVIIDQNERLERHHHRQAQCGGVRLIREISQSIFQALSSSLKGCSCSHALNLELQAWNPMVSPSKELDVIARELKFHVALGTLSDAAHDETVARQQQQQQSQTQPQNGSAAARVGRWDSLKIQLGEVESRDPQLMAQPPAQLAVASVSNSPKQPKWYTPLRVRFSRSPSPTSREPPAVVVVAPQQQLSNIVHRKRSQIPDICNLLRVTNSLDCYGYIVDTERCFDISPHDGNVCGVRSVTLQQVLLNGGSAGSRFGFVQQLRVAQALAAGVLHLYKTPWIAKHTVSPEDVVFFGADCTEPSWQPFVTATLGLPSSDPNPGAQIASRSGAPTSRNMNLTVISLGTVLVQMMEGHCIDELWVAPGMDPRMITSICGRAMRLLYSIYTKAGARFAAVVEWCLRSVNEEEGLDHETFQNSFYEHVVAPLDENLKLLGGDWW